MSEQNVFPLATALRSALRTYSFETFKEDATAGLIVSMIALPLAMALAIAVGLPPQHGIYTAIVAGIAAAVFGGSSVQVSGPTAAFVVIVAHMVSEFGLHGLIWCQIIAGFFLILLGMMRAGKLIRYVSYPVVTGFTAGIAVTIATLALKDFFGLSIAHMPAHYLEKVMAIGQALPEMKWSDTFVGALTLSTIFLLPKVTVKIPSSVAGILLGTVLSFFLARNGMEAATLMSQFSYAALDGSEATGIPPYPPIFHLPGEEGLFQIPGYDEIKTFLVPSLVIAALAALESLLSATVADGLSQSRHNPDAELNGIGIANIFSGLAAGIPATGAIARTAANIHNGAKTPFAAILHSLFILAYVMMLAPYISHIPMAALAALLISVAWRMSHAHQCLTIMKFGTASDRLILLTTLSFTVLFDMVIGVATGMALVGVKYLNGKRTQNRDSREKGL